MICLCNDINVPLNYFFCTNHSLFIKETIKLYLRSYGVKFDFCQLFIQYSEDKRVISVILRYNNLVFVVSDIYDDELCTFLQGFSECEITAGTDLSARFNGKICYVMQKPGEPYVSVCDKIKNINSAKEISSLVTKGYSCEKAEDFFLNTAHQLRHNLISVNGLYAENSLSCVVSLSNTQDEYSLITFVYTEEYFRGKGFAKEILSYSCIDPGKIYLLLCEEHNLKFYLKCGFLQAETCFIFELRG